jgi:hypothetical protein
VGCAGKGNEELVSIHQIAAVDGLGARAEASSADLELVGAAGLDRLAVGLSVKDSLFNHLAVASGTERLVPLSYRWR